MGMEAALPYIIGGLGAAGSALSGVPKAELGALAKKIMPRHDKTLIRR